MAHQQVKNSPVQVGPVNYSVTKQTKTISLIEAVINMASGILISTLIWMLIGPMFGYMVTFSDSLGFTLVFTIISIFRSYIWRRLFESHLNRWLHTKVHGNATV